jgi:colicin import membrane protein
VSAAAAFTHDRYGSRPRPAMRRAAVLSAVVHIGLLAVLFFGVRFQSNPPATVTVELWEAPPPPPPPPAVQEKPPPPKPVAQPEPEPQVKKPEIALPEKPKPKPKPEPKRDLASEKRLKEQVALEEKKIDEQRKERELRELIARQQAAARDKALASWTDKIRAKIRGNIVLPRDVPGNPEAIFDVTILPTGEVLTVRRRQSSGHAAYDDAVERAIMKSSPLPLPDDRAVFRRDLELKFRPQDR